MSNDDAFSASSDGEIILFGVKIKLNSSTTNINNDLSQSDSDHVVPKSSSRKPGVRWTEEEHKLFLKGLEELGRGEWKAIARNFVKTRTTSQVASHAQKHFLHQDKINRRSKSSVFDITTTDDHHQQQQPSRVLNEPSTEQLVYSSTRLQPYQEPIELSLGLQCNNQPNFNVTTAEEPIRPTLALFPDVA